MKNYIGVIVCVLGAVSIKSQGLSEDIRLNQVGFLPNAEKLAVVVNSTSDQFEIRKVNSYSAVYTGDLTAEAYWDDSDEDVRIADFSEMLTTGEYVVYVPGKGISHPFHIRNENFLSLAKGTIKAYYFNRASTALTEEFAGPYARPLGHPDDEVVVHPSAASAERPAGTILSTPYGWYDAGDYNKYIVNSGISTFTLLTAYENFPGFYDTLGLTIPEKDNEIPDILDEALWNINWMFSMQDPNDGGVYNKTTTANFEGAVMPHNATNTRYVVAKGTAATLDFAAVMAMAARIYEPYLPDFASACLEKAELAWEWAQANPNVPFNNPSAQNGYPAVNTGGYGDGNFADEFLWAAAELYITTKNDEYYQAMDLDQNYWAPGWPTVQTLALLSLATHRKELTPTADTTEVIDLLVTVADGFRNTTENHPYRIPINDFWWGSNSVPANMGMILLQAYELTGEVGYFNAALRSLDYLVGRNATTYSFVTGFGAKPPMNIHHRQSEADAIEEPVPGFLVGGPNPQNQNQDCGSAQYPSALSAKSYLDDWCSYSTNEVTINWNAPLVYLAGGIHFIYSRDFLTQPIPDTSEVVTEPPLGLNAVPDTGLMNVYPNPANRNITVEMKDPEKAGGELLLLSAEGKLIERRQVLGSDRVEFDHRPAGPGIYFLQYRRGDKVFTKKVVITTD